MNYASAALVVSLLSFPLEAQAVWSQLYPAASPAPSVTGVMACHEATDKVVYLDALSNDGWLLQGAAWSPMNGALPAQRYRAAMVYDSWRQQLVLFGGTVAMGSSLVDETWVYDGTAWSSLSPGVVPERRDGHAMAFDPDRGVVVLFGGKGPQAVNGNDFLEDLWEWDGTTWTQSAASTPLGKRQYVAAAFDPISRRVLLHGGQKSIPVGSSSYTSYVVNDTWSWDGATWQQHQPATPPTLRLTARAVTDEARQRVLLFGGYGGGSFAWEWDGANWQMISQASPSERGGHMMAYDAPNRRVVMFGGQWNSALPNSLLNDTWAYETATPADVVAFGAGCAGAAGAPALGAKVHSLPWLGDVHRNVVTNIAPGELGALFVASFGPISPIDLAPVGMPGCDLLVALDVLEFGLAVGGEAEWQFTVPNDPAVAGVSFYQQAFPLDGAANPLGFSASNGVVLTTGIR